MGNRSLGLVRWGKREKCGEALMRMRELRTKAKERKRERERERACCETNCGKLYSIVMHLDFTHRLVMMDVTSTSIPAAALAAWTSLVALISDSVGWGLPVNVSQSSSR